MSNVTGKSSFASHLNTAFPNNTTYIIMEDGVRQERILELVQKYESGGAAEDGESEREDGEIRGTDAKAAARRVVRRLTAGGIPWLKRDRRAGCVAGNCVVMALLTDLQHVDMDVETILSTPEEAGLCIDDGKDSPHRGIRMGRRRSSDRKLERERVAIFTDSSLCAEFNDAYKVTDIGDLLGRRDVSDAARNSEAVAIVRAAHRERRERDDLKRDRERGAAETTSTTHRRRPAKAAAPAKRMAHPHTTPPPHTKRPKPRRVSLTKVE
jgi:hypothetical protein